MKFFKSSLALLGAVALLVAPATAQEEKKEGGIWNSIKDTLIGEAPPSTFGMDPTGAILNITDAIYEETLFGEGEYIVAFCSATSPPCADYYPTYLEAAVTLKGESPATFAAVWVEENPRLSARFFVPARLPHLVYAKDGVFRQIPYVREDTQFLINFLEEEQYKFYNVMDGPMGPYSTLSGLFVKYADCMEWIGQYTSWMPKWMVYIIAGSMSGLVFQLFSGGSMYSSDPSKYPHLNPDGTLKETVNQSANATEGSTSTTTKSKSTKKRIVKKA